MKKFRNIFAIAVLVIAILMGSGCRPDVDIDTSEQNVDTDTSEQNVDTGTSVQTVDTDTSEQNVNTDTSVQNVSSAKQALAIGFADDETADSVTKDITLPSTVNDVSVSWKSSNASLISETGSVVRPGFDSGNANVTLTATLTKGSASDSKTFSLTVIAVPPYSFTVSFDSQSADTPANPDSITVTEPADVISSFPSDPVKSGFEFFGWYKDAECTEAFDISTQITADITLYAKWLAGIVVTPENVDTLDLSSKQGELTIIAKGDFNNKFEALNNAIKDYSDGIILDMTCVTGVEKIPDNAFYGCTGLTSVTIPDGVTSIGENAFYDSGLTDITIPVSVTYIGSMAFEVYDNINFKIRLVSINYKGTIEQFFSIRFNGVLNDECDIYIAGQKLTESQIPESIISYGGGIPCSLPGLRTVTIADGVTSIGEYAFFYCSELTSVTIPDSVTSIGENAFAFCSGLTSIMIPDSVTSIGESAFYDCTGLTSVTIPNSVTSIGVFAFAGCSGLTNVTIEDGVTSIGVGTFWWCTGLTSVTIPDSVTSITNGAFSNCTGLTSVIIPDGVTSIDRDAFDGCDNLTSAVFTDADNWKDEDGDDVDLSDSSVAAEILKSGIILRKE